MVALPVAVPRVGVLVAGNVVVFVVGNVVVDSAGAVVVVVAGATVVVVGGVVDVVVVGVVVVVVTGNASTVEGDADSGVWPAAMLAEIATAAMTMAAFIEAIGVVWGGDSDLGTGHPGTCRPANDGTVIHDGTDDVTCGYAPELLLRRHAA